MLGKHTGIHNLPEEAVISIELLSQYALFGCWLNGVCSGICTEFPQAAVLLSRRLSHLSHEEKLYQLSLCPSHPCAVAA